MYCAVNGPLALSPRFIHLRYQFFLFQFDFFICNFAFYSPTLLFDKGAIARRLDLVLTRRQREVMDFIANFLNTNGYSPSFEEVGLGMKLNSLATVHKHVSTLERKGYLLRDYNKSRSLEPGPRYLQEARRQRMEQKRENSRGSASDEIPFLGKIAAGRPVEAPEQQETISLGDFARGKDNVFVLQVRGDSMVDEHIVDGDYVIVEKIETASDGELVVALVGGMESTLKRIHREPANQIRLQPSNAQMTPIIVHASEVSVQGRVIGVMRKY